MTAERRSHRSERMTGDTVMGQLAVQIRGYMRGCDARQMTMSSSSAHEVAKNAGWGNLNLTAGA
jgi:hypothetical protein